jgi:hypothetical protein
MRIKFVMLDVDIPGDLPLELPDVLATSLDCQPGFPPAPRAPHPSFGWDPWARRDRGRWNSWGGRGWGGGGGGWAGGRPAPPYGGRPAPPAGGVYSFSRGGVPGSAFMPGPAHVQRLDAMAVQGHAGAQQALGYLANAGDPAAQTAYNRLGTDLEFSHM